MEIKICTKCKNEFDSTLEFFHAQKNGKNGLRSYCKKCACKENKIRRQTPESKEKHRIKMKAWREKNRDKFIEISRRYYTKNAERINASRREKYNNDFDFKQKCLDREKRYKESGRRYEVSSKPEQRNKSILRSRERRLNNELKEHDYKRNAKWRIENKEYLIELHKKRRGDLADSYVAQIIGVSVKDVPRDILETKKIIIKLKKELKNNNIKIK